MFYIIYTFMYIPLNNVSEEAFLLIFVLQASQNLHILILFLLSHFHQTDP